MLIIGEDPCKQVISHGNGRSVVNRWYFNSESRICASFAYSGSGGNQNNFLSREDCANTCHEYKYVVNINMGNIFPKFNHAIFADYILNY